jgi:amino acid transporter/nucleotide-binding universal stress UspA family protein
MVPRPRRPRELHWYHAGPMLFGDWGTSRLYVLGLCFYYTHHASLWFMLAMSALLVLLGWAYSVICRLHPDGGGVYSSARERSQMLAVVGGLLLCADYIITASISALDAFHYLNVPHPEWWAAVSIAAIGMFNFFGPRKSGTGALVIAVLTVAMTIVIASFAVPSLPQAHIERPSGDAWQMWRQFVSIILAVSGVEAVANMTGIMVRPVERTSKLAIYPVLAEIVTLNLLLTLAMLAVPAVFLGDGNVDAQYTAHRDDMLRALAEYYVGPRFAAVSSLVFALLLLSAVNTALSGLVSIQFMMARDGELPKNMLQLNGYGVPLLPLLLATGVPLTVLLLFPDVAKLADLYAIGVVGAITINLGATATARRNDLASWERLGLALLAALMLVVWLTIAVTKVHALIFALVVLGAGLGARWLVRHRAELADSISRLPTPLRKAITPAPTEGESGSETAEAAAEAKHAYEPKGIVMVAARGGNPRLLQFAVEEAKSRQAELRVLFVRQLAILPMGPDEELLDARSDQEASKLFAEVDRLAREAGVPWRPVYTASDNVAAMIAETAVIHGADVLILGASQRGPLWKAMKGDVIQEVGQYLPESVRLIIHA